MVSSVPAMSSGRLMAAAAAEPGGAAGRPGQQRDGLLEDRAELVASVAGAGRGGELGEVVGVGEALQQVGVDVPGDDGLDRGVAAGTGTGGAALAAAGERVEGD